MFGIVGRYLAGTWLRLFLLCQGGFLAVYLILDFMEKLGRFSKAGASLSAILQFFLFKIPEMLGQTMPFAVLMATLLALGGASWPRLGSNGAWADILAARGVAVTPFRPANCGFEVAWSEVFKQRFQGQPLKNVALTFAGRTVRGEAMVTAYGLEGGAIYALAASLRDAIAADGRAVLAINLCPDRPAADLKARLAKPRGKHSMSDFLRRALGLPPIAINLMREAAGPSLPAGPEALAGLAQAVPLELIAPAPIERAISTAGGIALSELDGAFMIRRLPGVFAAGEMLDWEAPTGGYLLTGAFASGAAAAAGALAWLGGQGSR